MRKKTRICSEYRYFIFYHIIGSPNSSRASNVFRKFPLELRAFLNYETIVPFGLTFAYGTRTYPQEVLLVWCIRIFANTVLTVCTYYVRSRVLVRRGDKNTKLIPLYITLHIIRVSYVGLAPRVLVRDSWRGFPKRFYYLSSTLANFRKMRRFEIFSRQRDRCDRRCLIYHHILYVSTSPRQNCDIFIIPIKSTSYGHCSSQTSSIKFNIINQHIQSH